MSVVCYRGKLLKNRKKGKVRRVGKYVSVKVSDGDQNTYLNDILSGVPARQKLHFNAKVFRKKFGVFNSVVSHPMRVKSLGISPFSELTNTAVVAI